MYNFVERRPIWFIISLIAILPGLFLMIWSLVSTGAPLPLSIDYTGGTLWELRFDQPVDPMAVREVFTESDYPDTTAFLVEDDRTVQIKFKNIDGPQKEELKSALAASALGAPEERSYRSIGPSIGSEVSRAALVAIAVAALLILIYIAIVFRS